MHVALPRTRGAEKIPPSDQRLGFLAAGRDPQLGYVGGYLITTSSGRPHEFHYTTPVKPSPIHRILYGADLEPYIFGELIGANLIRQSAVETAFLLTDQPMLLGQRLSSSCPIIFVLITAIAPDAEKGVRNLLPERPEGCFAQKVPDTFFCSGSNLEFKSWPGFEQDVETLNRWIHEVNPGLDLREPFGRVWEALREVLGAESKQAA